LTNQLRLIGRHVRRIRRSLAAIGAALRRLDRQFQKTRAARGGGGGGPRPATRRKLSPRRRAALKLQGQYIGHIRVLRPRQKAQVKAIRDSKGVRAAIALAQRLSRS
jgi:hypothetical protein